MTKRQKYTDEQIVEALREANGNKSEAARLLGVPRRTMNHWINNLPVEKINAVRDPNNVQKLYNMTVAKNKTNKDFRSLVQALNARDTFFVAMDKVVRRLNSRHTVPKYTPKQGKTPMTIELLLSDLQIGKLGDQYNTEIAKKRLQEYTRSVMIKLSQHQQEYNVERIVLAMVGDIIESDKKHANSARACDTGTAEQVADAIEAIHTHVLLPLSLLGIPMDVICITGNHDHDGHGIEMFQPGKTHLSFPLYTALEIISKACKFKHVKFQIPHGVHGDTVIYGSNILYEHGVGVSVTEKALFDRMAQRSNQVRKLYSMFRMGDKHSVTAFKAGTLVVNGAFFGTDKTGSEYSSICGFSNVPAQVMFCHVPRKADDERNTIYDQFTIQLGHIT